MNYWRIVNQILLIILIILGWNTSALGVLKQTQFRLMGSDLISNIGHLGYDFGWSVSVSGDYAIVGAPVKASGRDIGNKIGAAYIFKRSGGTWGEMAKLSAGSNSKLGDHFGISVSIDADYAIVGADSSAYIFKRIGEMWSQQATVPAVGFSVSLDGDYAIVAHDDSAYVYTRSGTEWSQQAAIDPVGSLVSIGGDYAIAGDAIYVRENTTWVKQATLPNLAGAFVDIDGDYAISGHPNDNGSDVGAAYIFERNGEIWTETKLVPSDPKSIGRFGVSVSISGNYAVVGSYYGAEAGDPERNIGSVFLFGKGGNNWSEIVEFTYADRYTNHTKAYAYSASLSDKNLFVGAYLDGDPFPEQPPYLTDFSQGTVYAYGLNPVLLTSNPVNFADILVGNSGLDSVKVKNNGLFELTVSSVSLAGADSVLFTVTPDTLSLAAGDSAYVKVTYAPTAVGADTASLVLTHNAEGSPTSIPLTGTGIDPAIATSSFLTFGDVPLVNGSATVTSSIKIKNTGTTSLTVTPQNNMGGGFTVSPSQLTVSPGDSVKLAVALSATTVGRKDASLVLDHNDTSKGSQTTIAVHANVYSRVQGGVVAWGDNNYGQTNIPADLGSVVATGGGWRHSLALKSDGTVILWGKNYEHEQDAPEGLTDVVAVSVGSQHNLALKSDSTVVAWGNNGSGQANVPSDLTGVIAISAGGYHSLAHKSDGTVVAWGANDLGQANVPSDLTGVIAISGGFWHSLALKSDGTVVAWGNNGNGQANVPTDLKEVTAISGGEHHSLALKSDATVVAWGGGGGAYYDDGQADVPQDLTGVTAISAGGNHSLAFKSDSTVVAWGSNRSPYTNDSNQAIVPAGLDSVIAIAGARYHTLALIKSKPAIASFPSSLSFGNVVLSSSPIDSIKIKNPGTGPLSVSGIAVTGADSVQFTVTPATLSVSAGDSAYVKVTFTPGSLGAKAASLVLTHNAEGGPTSTPLTGTGIGPVIEISPAQLVMGSVPSDSSSVGSLKVKNTGSSGLIVSGITIGGTNASNFSVSPTSLAVGVGDSTQVSVTFSAGESTAPRSAFLEITHNAQSGSSVVPLRANQVSFVGEYLVSTYAGNGQKSLWDDYRTEAEFYRPTSIDIDEDGSFYIADDENDAIRIINALGSVSSITGFNHPQGVAAGPDGIYVSDTNNWQIKKVGSDGNISTVAGSGTSGFLDGPALSARFHHTRGLTVNSEGIVYIADTYNNRIRKLDSSGNVSTIAGGTEGFLDGSGINARFYEPYDVAINSQGELIVPDYKNHRIRRIDADGNVTTIAGSSPGYADGLAGDALFEGPAGVAVDHLGNIFVAEATGDRIRKIDVSGNVTTVAGRRTNQHDRRDGIGAEAKFAEPIGLVVSPSGDIFVADSQNDVVRKITLLNPQISIDADTLHFANLQVGRSSSDTVSISSVGATPLTISSVDLAGAGKTHFSINYQSVDEGDSVIGAVTVNFTPTSAGEKAAVLIINHDAPNSPYLVQLTGTGIEPPIMAAVPDTLVFGIVEGGDTKTVNAVMINNGAAPAHWQWPSIGGDDPVAFRLPAEYGTGEKRIAPGDTLILPVTFAPDDSASFSAVLSMPYDGPTSPLTIVLKGEGHPEPDLRLSLGDAHVMRGEKLHVPVILHNASLEAVGGLQFDVVTPDSLFTFSGVTDSLTGLDFNVSGQETQYGVTILVFTTSSDLIPAGETVVGTIVYDVTPVTSPQIRDERVGNFPFAAANAEIVDGNGTAKAVKYRPGNIAVGIRGDSNNDGSVSIADVVMTVRVILGKEPPPAPVEGTLEYALMDANGNEAINVADVVIQVNRVLGRPIDQPLSRVVYSPVTVDLGRPVTSGTGIAVPLSVITGTPVSGLQLTYTFDPSRMTIGTPMLTAASDDVSLQWHIEDGTLNVIAYSLEGKAITLGHESVMIPVTVPEGMRPEITLTNVVLSDLYGNTVPVRLGQTRVSVAAAPTSFSLATARPNPFNPSTTIAYEVPEQTHITLTVYNLLGQEVVRLVDQVQAAGRYEAVWNGNNITGAGVASGIYLYRITSGTGYTETKRMTLLK